MSEKIISHPGFIRNISGHNAEITIISKSGCASCEINGSCSVSDTEEKIVEVSLNQDQNYKRGDQVIIEMRQSQGMWAVLLAYVLPFILILSSLIVLTQIGMEQGIAGLISLGLLLPYYLILYLTRDTIKKNFEYRIKA